METGITMPECRSLAECNGARVAECVHGGGDVDSFRRVVRAPCRAAEPTPDLSATRTRPTPTSLPATLFPPAAACVGHTPPPLPGPAVAPTRSTPAHSSHPCPLAAAHTPHTTLIHHHVAPSHHRCAGRRRVRRRPGGRALQPCGRLARRRTRTLCQVRQQAARPPPGTCCGGVPLSCGGLGLGSAASVAASIVATANWKSVLQYSEKILKEEARAARTRSTRTSSSRLACRTSPPHEGLGVPRACR